MARLRSLRAESGPRGTRAATRAPCGSSLALLPRCSLCFLERYSVIDGAYNPAVLQRAEEDRGEMEHLIRLTLKFVGERCGLALSPSYTLETFKLKGSLERLQQSLTGDWGAAAPLSQSPRRELTLAELLRGTEDCTRAPVLLQDSLKQSNPPLIEESSCPEVPEELRTPVYEMLTVKDANKKPRTIELKIELPKVSSVSECDLSISKDDIIIEVSGKYKLELHLPQLVDVETTTAVFSKGKRTLLITMPVAQPEHSRLLYVRFTLTAATGQHENADS